MNLLLGLLIVLGASALNAFGLNLTKLDHVRPSPLSAPSHSPFPLLFTPSSNLPLNEQTLETNISPDFGRRMLASTKIQMKNARLPKSQRRPDYLRPVWIVGMLVVARTIQLKVTPPGTIKET